MAFVGDAAVIVSLLRCFVLFKSSHQRTTCFRARCSHFYDLPMLKNPAGYRTLAVSFTLRRKLCTAFRKKSWISDPTVYYGGGSGSTVSAPYFSMYYRIVSEATVLTCLGRPGAKIQHFSHVKSAGNWALQLRAMPPRQKLIEMVETHYISHCRDQLLPFSRLVSYRQCVLLNAVPNHQLSGTTPAGKTQLSLFFSPQQGPFLGPYDVLDPPKTRKLTRIEF